jgi:hypothetical protein
MLELGVDGNTDPCTKRRRGEEEERTRLASGPHLVLN